MIFFSMEKPDPLAKHEEQSKFASNAPQRSTAMRRNKRSSLKMQQTLQQPKKR
jgi:hypothetical protein